MKKDNNLLAICSWLAMLFVVFGSMFVLSFAVKANCDKDASWLTMWGNALADSLVIMAPFWLLPRKGRGFYWIVAIVIAIWTMVQSVYSRVFFDLMPFSSFGMTGNVNGMLMDSIFDLLSWKELIVPGIMLVCVLFYWLAKKMFGLAKGYMSFGCRLLWFLGSLVVAAVYFVSMAGGTFYMHRSEKDACYWMRYTDEEVEPKEYFAQNGFCAYCCDVVRETLEVKSKKAKLDEYLSTLPHYTDNKFATAKGKNLILIVVESMNSWLLHEDFKGEEVTPYFNSLCRSDSVIFVPRLQMQVRHGNSSDAHHMYNTGLMPLKSGALANLFHDEDYPSLCKALKGYNCITFEGGERTIWSKDKMYASYGFSKSYDCGDIFKAFGINGSEKVTDRQLFEMAANEIKKSKQPFYAQILTLTMHAPYTIEPDLPRSWISKKYKNVPDNVLSYLEKSKHFDDALKYFIDELKAAGLYDNTVIVIASDHSSAVNGNVRRGGTGTDYKAVEIPAVILNSGRSLKVTDLVSQADIYPTILDIMGANDYAWKGFGTSLLRTKKHYTDNDIKEFRKEYMRHVQASEVMTRLGYFNKK